MKLFELLERGEVAIQRTCIASGADGLLPVCVVPHFCRGDNPNPFLRGDGREHADGPRAVNAGNDCLPLPIRCPRNRTNHQPYCLY